MNKHFKNNLIIFVYRTGTAEGMGDPGDCVGPRTCITKMDRKSKKYHQQILKTLFID